MDEVSLLNHERNHQSTQDSFNLSPSRRKKWPLIIVGLLFCLYFTYFFINPTDPSIRILDVSSKFLSNDHNSNQQFKLLVRSSNYSTSSLSLASPLNLLHPVSPIILLWTGAFDSDTWWGATKSPLNCDCIVTRNRNLLSQAKVVLFYWRNTNLADLPKYKFEGQTWIWHHMESPMNTFRRSSLAVFSNYTDCWSTYRSDSDFSTPYGTVQPTDSSQPNLKTNAAPFSEKTRNVAWMVSNCGASSGRDEYAKELARYIDVDIYGACGSFKCPSSKGSYCYQYIEKKYRYYLSFENSICSDYYTEKIINLLNYTVIPIVLGGANYSSILPNHSYIDALSFKSPRYLAMLLRNLAVDEKRFNSYFEWKSHYSIHTNDYRKLFCQICSRLKKLEQTDLSSSTKDNNLKSKASQVLCNRRHKDLVGWWFDGGSCRSWKTASRF